MAVGRMQQFLQDIPTTGVPEKVTVKYLEERSFKSTNDRTIVPLLKFLGLIDAAGGPTTNWKALRDRENYGRVMAQLVRQSYAGLFDVYPDAPSRSEREIHNYIGKNTDSALRMVSAMVAVFKMLCSLSDFESEAVSPEEVAANRPGTDKLSRGTEKLSQGSVETQNNGISIRLNLSLSENATEEQIEATFKYAAKYLMGREV